MIIKYLSWEIKKVNSEIIGKSMRVSWWKLCVICISYNLPAEKIVQDTPL